MRWNAASRRQSTSRSPDVGSGDGPDGAASLGALLRLVHARLAAHDTAGALDAAGGAIALDPTSPRARAAWAMARLADGGDDPNAEVWFDLGRASVELGQFDEGARALKKAVSLGAGAAAEVDLAMLHALRGEPLRAMDELRGLVRRHPALEEARVRLAWLMLAEGGEAAVLELLGGKTTTPDARAARSLALLRSGRLEAARAALPLDTAPGLPVMLQRLRLAIEGAAEAVPAVAREVASLVEDPRRERPEHRVEAYFQLGALYARDQPDIAFRHWRQGHEILARAQPFSRQRHAALLEAHAAAWDGAWFAGTERAASGPVFIVGLPRSGTTLAEHILSAHPAVHGAGERVEIIEAAGRLGGGVLDPASPGRAACAGRAALAQEAERYVAALCAGAPAGARRILDKMPANDMQLGLIAAMLPGAKVIHCRRDLRATGLSIYQRHLSGYHPYAHDLGDLGWWMRAQVRLMAHWRRSLTLPILDLELEDWQRDFRGTLARVLDFMELPYDRACEDFHLQDRTVRTASRDQVRQPVRAASAEWARFKPWLGLMLAEL